MKTMENCQIQENLEETISDVLEVVLDRYWWPTVSQDVRDASPTTRSEIHHQARMLDHEGAHDCHRQALLAATRNDLVELRRLVLEEGAGLFARGDIEGESAIHHAVKNRNF